MPVRVARRRRRLQVTSLIDVIFLLLLFFMLSSTFSRYTELPLAMGGAGAVQAPRGAMVFLRLTPGGTTLNGAQTTLDDLPDTLRARADLADTHLVISVAEGVPAQDLVTLLSVLPGQEAQAVTVLEPAL
ncbi:MAG: biopolymer transporter ExbD [Qingshengfaniella sp.]